MRIGISHLVRRPHPVVDHPDRLTLAILVLCVMGVWGNTPLRVVAALGVVVLIWIPLTWRCIHCLVVRFRHQRPEVRPVGGPESQDGCG